MTLFRVKNCAGVIIVCGAIRRQSEIMLFALADDEEDEAEFAAC